MPRKPEGDRAMTDAERKRRQRERERELEHADEPLTVKFRRLGRCAEAYREAMVDLAFTLARARGALEIDNTPEKLDLAWREYLVEVTGGRHDPAPEDIEALLALAKYHPSNWEYVVTTLGRFSALRPVEILRMMEKMYEAARDPNDETITLDA